MTPEAFLVLTVGNRDATGVQWANARDAAQCPSTHGTAPITENNQP